MNNKHSFVDQVSRDAKLIHKVRGKPALAINHYAETVEGLLLNAEQDPVLDMDKVHAMNYLSREVELMLLGAFHDAEGDKREQTALALSAGLFVNASMEMRDYIIKAPKPLMSPEEQEKFYEINGNIRTRLDTIKQIATKDHEGLKARLLPERTQRATVADRGSALTR